MLLEKQAGTLGVRQAGVIVELSAERLLLFGRESRRAALAGPGVEVALLAL